MEECGVCGGEAVGQGMVEGARLFLCDICMGYASKVFVKQEAIRPRLQVFEKKKELVLVDGFGLRIQKAREARGWSRKVFAEKTFIRENELTAFEEEKLKPVEAIARKMEFTLGIKILEEESGLESIAREARTSKGGEFSLGDLVKIKKK